MQTNIPTPQTPVLDERTGLISRIWWRFFRDPIFNTVNLAGVIPVDSGGTGISTGSPGGVLFFTTTQSIDTSPTLRQNGLVIGGGAGNAPISISALGLNQIVVGQSGSAPIGVTVTGDASLSGGTFTVKANAITNAKLAQAAANTLKGNNTASTANVQDLTVSQVLSMLSVVSQTVTSWTPADNSGATLTFTGVSVSATKVGNMVFAYGTLTYPTTLDVSAASIAGLPFPVPNQDYAQVPAVVSTTISISGGLVLVPTKNTSTAKFDVGSPFGPVTNAQLSGSTLKFNLAYPAT